MLLISGDQKTAELLSEARGKGFEFQILAKPVHPLTLFEQLNLVVTPEKAN